MGNFLWPLQAATPWFCPRGDEESRPQEVAWNMNVNAGSLTGFQESPFRWWGNLSTGNKQFRTLQVLHQGKSNVLIIASPELRAIFCSQSLKTLGSSRPNPTLHRRFFVISKEFNLPITPALLMNRLHIRHQMRLRFRTPREKASKAWPEARIWNKRFVRATGCEHVFFDWFYSSDFRNMIPILNLWIPTSWLPDSETWNKTSYRSTSWLEYHLKILIILIILIYSHHYLLWTWLFYAILGYAGMPHFWTATHTPGIKLLFFLTTQEPCFLQQTYQCSAGKHGENPVVSMAVIPTWGIKVVHWPLKVIAGIAHLEKRWKNAVTPGGCGSFLRVSFIWLYIDTYIMYFNEF